jgi:exonuclease SbcC
MNDMVATVRRRRQELDAALAATSLRLGTAARSLAATEARQSETNRGIDVARRRTSVAAAGFTEQRSILSVACADAGLAPPAPLDPNDQGASGLATFGATVRAERLSIASPLAEARRLRTEIDRLQPEHDALGVAIEAAAGNIDELRSGLHAAQLKVSEHSVRGVELAERLESVDREIGPFLVAGARTLEELDVDPEGVAADLTLVAQEFGALRKQVGELDLTLQQLAPDRAVAAASLEHARLQTTETAAHLGQRRSVVDEKTLARAGVLDGEPTGAHRTRINEARRTARETLAAVREEKSAAAAALQGAGARCEETASAVEAAKRRRASAEDTFDTACQSVSRPRDEVAALIFTDPSVRLALRAGLLEIDRALNDSAAAVLTRQTDLRRALEATAAIAALATEIGELHQRTGVVSALLLRDDAARLAAATMSAEIESAKKELETWQAVDDAIGSASGDRFRRFVQGVTLDHLVQLANDHLSALSPRYRLARGTASDLTLQIVDRDMGDEIRATRSLSGGERFLVSLALALALSGLEGRASFVDTLFIDEGFGSLDAETLDIAVDALETLQGRGQKVGVITHVAAMIDRIAVQVCVEKRGAGRSEIRIVDGVRSMWSATEISVAQ